VPASRNARREEKVTRQLETDELASPEVWRGMLGTKVSLRYRIHDDPAHPFSEAIGFVQSVVTNDADETLTIVNRRGRESKMALADILAAKAF
jgi:hypothetical protein